MRELPDPTHLLDFRVSETSYHALLTAVREVIHERGILMPFLPADVFLRHKFLGGFASASGGWHRLREPTSEEIIDALTKGTPLSQEQRLLERLLKEFFQLAVAQGDMVYSDVPLRTGGVMIGYALIGALWDNPPVGELAMYQEPRHNKEPKDKRHTERASKLARPKSGRSSSSS